jgi:hypothetical protein
MPSNMLGVGLSGPFHPVFHARSEVMLAYQTGTPPDHLTQRGAPPDVRLLTGAVVPGGRPDRSERPSGGG